MFWWVMYWYFGMCYISYIVQDDDYISIGVLLFAVLAAFAWPLAFIADIGVYLEDWLGYKIKRGERD